MKSKDKAVQRYHHFSTASPWFVRFFMSGKNQHEPNPQQSLVTKTHK